MIGARRRARRPDNRRRKIDETFGEDYPDFVTGDDEASHPDENPWDESGKIIAEAKMQRGFVFRFTDPAIDPFAATAPNFASIVAPSAIGLSERDPQITADVLRPDRNVYLEIEPRPSGSGRGGPSGVPKPIADSRSLAPVPVADHVTKRRIWRTARIVVGLFLALAGLAGSLWSSGANSVTNVSPAHTATPQFPLRPIESIHVGDRVITDEPSRMSSETAVDPATWRLVVLRGDVRDDAGEFVGSVNVETLQPPEWIAEQRAEIGALVQFPLDLIEMGLSGDLAATVMAIRTCPAVQPGRGRVVISTVSSPSNSVMELSLRHTDGRTESIRPTAGHKFYSEDRQEWLPTRNLLVGEQLRGMTGAITITASRQIAGNNRVYNMTVEADHRYHVAGLGVLSHNNPCPDPPIPPVVYRSGPATLNNLTPRPQDGGMLSTRGSLSNPIQPGVPGPLGGRPVFPPGGKYTGIGTSQLPTGSVHPDGAPYGPMEPGHVSIGPNVPPGEVGGAVLPGQSGKFPK